MPKRLRLPHVPFQLTGVTTGTYTFAPVLDIGQDANPNSFTATVTSTGSVFIGTFTISGAYGSINGTVTDNSALVTAGALIITSTASIPSSPPSIAASPLMTGLQNFFLMTSARYEIQRDARASLDVINRFLRESYQSGIVIDTPAGQGPYSHIAFTFPHTDDVSIVSVAITMGKNVQLGRQKVLKLTIQKVRVMN